MRPTAAILLPMSGWRPACLPRATHRAAILSVSALWAGHVWFVTSDPKCVADAALRLMLRQDSETRALLHKLILNLRREKEIDGKGEHTAVTARTRQQNRTCSLLALHGQSAASQCFHSPHCQAHILPASAAPASARTSQLPATAWVNNR